MRTADLQYDLPPELIAQQPADRRDASRLLVLDRATGARRHETFARLPELLPPGSLLVLNDTRVLPARLCMRRATGGRVEGLFLSEPAPGVWEVMLTGAGRVRDGEELTIGGSSRRLRLRERIEASTWRAEPIPAGGAIAILNECGRTPLPPYIRRERVQVAAGDAPWRGSGFRVQEEEGETRRGGEGETQTLVRDSHLAPTPAGSLRERIPAEDGARKDSRTSEGKDSRTSDQEQRDREQEKREHEQERRDRERYQTVYARRPGAVAAPTAGLHFTQAVFDRIRAVGMQTTFVTLHVGVGTFAPIRCDDLADHEMHAEWYDCSALTAAAINEARQQGRPVVAVGTTSVRVLETCARDDGCVEAGSGWTKLFIYPPHRIRAVDKLLTNFHLPGSTLLAMIFALAGREAVLAAYQDAIEQRYRFYSYGDAMLVV